MVSKEDGAMGTRDRTKNMLTRAFYITAGASSADSL